MPSEYNVPNIIKETCTGSLIFQLEDEMLSKRKINCFGVINHEMVNSIIMQLIYLNNLNSEQEITMYINSGGGEVTSGLALYDTMKLINSPIKTVCLGQACSMAAILFSSGDTREILPHSQVMIHDPLIQNIGGTALDIGEYAKSIMQTREVIAQILASNTNKPIEKILEKTASDTYFNAQQAIEFGLADKVVESL